MKGVIRKAVAALGCAVVAAGAVGCHTCGGCGHGGCDYDLYDRCYPERYWYMARKEVNAALAPQVQNGHVLDQTVWNHHFEVGTDRLTPGGMEHLAYLAR